jgi:Flp pilus assembly pilin Flp
MHATRQLPFSLKNFLRAEDGISFIEFALLASLIAVVGGVAVLAIGKQT